MNTVVLVGRAGRDPEIRYFESGSSVASLSIAVDGYGRDAEPHWFDLEIWGKSSEFAANYVRKGARIGVSGSLQQQSWTDKATGQKRSKVLVKAGRLELLETKAERAEREGHQQGEQQTYAQQGQARPPAPVARGGAPAEAWAQPSADELPF